MPRARSLAALFVVLGGLTPPARLAAQQTGLDPEPNAPYQWRVVVQFDPHPLLSPAFRDQLRRDLLAALQPAVGPLGTVEVVDLDDLPADRRDPVVGDFAQKGFAALDAPRDLTGVKTHFLKVEVRDGAYHLRARQHDGFTGLASPVVRKQTVPAPELVGRAAGLMIDRDFGLAGTVEPGKEGVATVRFRAAGLGPVGRHVAAEDILAISRITQTKRAAAPVARNAAGRVIAPAPGTVAPPALTPTHLPFTLLRVKEVAADGTARCEALTGYKNGAFPPARDAAGFRCLKLGTTRSRVAVRLASSDGTGGTGVTVRATDQGFGDNADATDFLDRDPATGVFRGGRQLKGLACVTVALGATRTARFPVPVLGPDPVPLPFEVDAQKEEQAVFERAVLSARARASDARAAQTLCFEEVARRIVAGNNKDALARARAGYDAADTTGKVLAEEVTDLKGQVAKGPQGSPELLAQVEQQLAALGNANAQLKERIGDLEAVAGRATVKGGVEVLARDKNNLIGLYLAQGKVDEALTVYAQLITLLPDNADVKARRDKLAAEWKPKDAAHEEARTYLLQRWPRLANLGDLNESLPQLQAAVEVCKKNGDKYAFRQFRDVLGAFPGKLADLTRDLDPNADADRAARATAKKVADEVGKYEPEVAEFLKANP
ncbi:MAG: hypothetical protein K2X82_13025 [Gemmataceae bacterium]|nr:hypothetical protein [Gemmataceae bacterium]